MHKKISRSSRKKHEEGQSINSKRKDTSHTHIEMKLQKGGGGGGGIKNTNVEINF
jgi:hypothetical protein